MGTKCLDPAKQALSFMVFKYCHPRESKAVIKRRIINCKSLSPCPSTLSSQWYQSEIKEQLEAVDINLNTLGNSVSRHLCFTFLFWNRCLFLISLVLKSLFNNFSKNLPLQLAVWMLPPLLRNQGLINQLSRAHCTTYLSWMISSCFYSIQISG